MKTPTATTPTTQLVNMKPVESNLLGMGREVKAGELAIAAGENLIFMGPAGTAKSLLADQLFANFEGDVFKTQISKNTDETAIFGMPNMKILRETGEVEYNANAAHTIFNAHYAFIDEMFDGSDVLLRSLLGILNEREFVRSNQRIQCKLISCIATSNYARVNEVTHAVVDRFALAVGMNPLSRKEREHLYNGLDFEGFSPKSKVSLGTLLAIRQSVTSVKMHEQYRDVTMRIAEKLEFSPRRERKAAKLIRTRAAMQGRLEVTEADLIDVIPMMVPLCADMTEYTKNVDSVRKELKATMASVVKEKAQYEKIAQLGELGSLTGAERAKAAVAAIAGLAEIEPITEHMASVMKQKEDYLTVEYNKVVEGLGLTMPVKPATPDTGKAKSKKSSAPPAGTP